MLRILSEIKFIVFGIKSNKTDLKFCFRYKYRAVQIENVFLFSVRII